MGNAMPSRLRITNQDGVSDDLAARDGELTPVARPIVGRDDVLFEVCQLRGLASVNGLAPNVAHVVRDDCVEQRAPVAGPVQNGARAAEARRNLESLEGLA